MSGSGDLSPRWIFVKAGLFLVIGVVAAGLLLAESFSWRTAFLLALMAWSAARFYYFLFFVIERSIDPTYKFSGVGSALRYLARRDSGPRAEESDRGSD